MFNLAGGKACIRHFSAILGAFGPLNYRSSENPTTAASSCYLWCMYQWYVRRFLNTVYTSYFFLFLFNENPGAFNVYLRDRERAIADLLVHFPEV